MARGVNKVILIGNVGKDPELRQMPTGGAVVNVSMATSDSWKDKTSGEKRERTEWHTVVFFNRLADIVGQYVKKGSKIYIEGSLRTRKWQDRDGNDRYSTEIVASEMQMLDSRGGSSASFDGEDYGAASSQPPSPPATTTAPPAGGQSAGPGDFEDDDIPF